MADFDEYAYLEQQLDRHRANSKEDKRIKSHSHRERGERSDRAGAGREHAKAVERSNRASRDDRDQRDPRGTDYAFGRAERGMGSFYGSGRGGHPGRGDKHYSRDKEPRKRSRSPNSRRERPRTPPEVRTARAQEEELLKLEKDTRTVFAYNLNLKAEEKDIYMFFSLAGTVTDVKLIRDRSTRRSKGFAYIEYERQEHVLPALALTGQTLLGQAVMVKMSEAEKNMAWEAQQQAAATQNQQAAATAALINGSNMNSSAGPCKLHVTGLDTQIGEMELKKMFDPIGAVDYIQVTRDPSGRSQGSAVVQYKTVGEASRAQAHWNGRELLGQELRITLSAVNSNDPSMGSLTELDEDDDMGGGVRFSSQARVALMNRLANSAGLQAHVALPPALTSVPPSTKSGSLLPSSALSLEQGVLGPASPIPTPCVLLKNMFDPAQETEEDWQVGIEQDVKEEAGKFGLLRHVFVDKNSKGHVYLKFGAVEGACKAQAALHGRWFSGKQILAEYQFLAPYNSFFRL